MNYTVSDTTIDGTVKLNGTSLTEGVMSQFLSHPTQMLIWIIPDPDDYGLQTITLTAYDAIDPMAGPLQKETSASFDFAIDFDITRVDDDPIDLNEGTSIDLTPENKAGNTL